MTGDGQLAVIVNLGHGGVGRRVLGPVGDVFEVAVGEVGADEELLLGARRENAMRRNDL